MLSLRSASSRCFSSKSGLGRKDGLKLSIGGRLLKFLQSYDEFLQKFPRLYRVFHIFSIGTRDLYLDFVQYMKVSKDLALGKNVKNLTYKELMNYYEVPKALSRVAPTLLISILPFANYIVFPLAYKYPRVYLSSHYWTLDQRVDFALDDHKKRLLYFKPVFRHLQNNLKFIQDEQIRESVQSIFYILGSGMHPQLQQILLVNSVFRGKPYGVHYLHSGHLSDLCSMHGLRPSRLFSRRSRLTKYANTIGQMDDAIIKEGGASTLPIIELRKACFLRGLNPINMSRHELVTWLESWLSLSSGISEDSRSSTLLHAPILLAYNQPSNWKLIY